MSARFDAPVEVFVGSFAALVAVSGIAVLAGRTLLKYVKLSLIQTIGGLVCAALALYTTYQTVIGLA
jgi:putative Ca2+/H+ antiporter (TMEM165/GDT1 family)